MTDMEARILTPWLTYKGFEARILVNGAPVTRYSAEYKDSTNEASAWIPSEANKTFAVYYRKTVQDEYDYCMSLFLDGNRVTSAVAQKCSGTKEHRVSFVRVSPTEVREFVFNSAALTDDDTYLDNPSCKGVGEIKVVLEAVKIVNETKPPKIYSSELMGGEKIHESLMKGLIHQVGYESKTAMPSDEPPRKWLHYKPMGKPVTLIFKYRSLDMLQANGIAPRSTPPIVGNNAIKISKRQPSEVQTSVETITRCSASSEVKEDIDEESDEEETDQIVIKSLRTLLLELEKAAKKKRAKKETRGTSKDATSTEEKKEPLTAHLIASETAELTASQENAGHPKKKAKNSHHKVHEVIDLTWI